jgi:hypothetical protein
MGLHGFELARKSSAWGGEAVLDAQSVRFSTAFLHFPQYPIVEEEVEEAEEVEDTYSPTPI